jgi:hypothetical protein
VHTPREILEKLQRGPLDPEKLLEFINVVDQKADELKDLIDNQGSDVIKLAIYTEAFEKILLDKGIVSPEELRDALVHATQLVSQQVTDNPEDSTSEVSDIVL